VALSDALLAEFDREMAVTRKALERIPESKLPWQPHPKSMTMARLAGHLAEIPGWGWMTLEKDSFDLQPPGAPPYQPFVPATRQDVLDLFDKNVGSASQALCEASDEQLQKPWSLLFAEKTVFTMPRLAALRGMVLNHNIHHRAQLGVYLRLNDIAVPSTYGPSADEQ
jgi:uncharacterized damage-inducible protein DinB